jgi:hypothetical protein
VSTVRVTFTTRGDGQVDVDLGPDLRLFGEALNDCVSSLPPRRQPGNGPSVYWIDVALSGLERAESDSSQPFTAGNITYLTLNGGRVEARYDFAEPDEPGEFMAVEEFRALLLEWRMRVEQAATDAISPLPETYRRNPAVRET